MAFRVLSIIILKFGVINVFGNEGRYLLQTSVVKVPRLQQQTIF